ncbi:MAG: TonB family protein [Candidatus Thiodiazotropha sp.]
MQLISAQRDRLGITLLLAATFHAFVILGITIKPFDRARPEHRQQSLEIMVVNHMAKPPKEEEKPDFLAQATQQGGGEERERVKPSFEESPLPMPPPQPVQAKPQPQQQRLTATASPQKTQQDQPPEALPVTLSASQLLTSKNREIARLTAELERKTQAYAKMPKLERIGNLNYPDQAKRDRLYGNLVLHVAVRADGSVERVRVLHSSGHKILDDAAVRIVRMSAPYSPFPEEIRKETDILDITRTWQFLRSGQFGTE